MESQKSAFGLVIPSPSRPSSAERLRGACVWDTQQPTTQGSGSSTTQTQPSSGCQSSSSSPPSDSAAASVARLLVGGGGCDVDRFVGWIFELDRDGPDAAEALGEFVQEVGSATAVFGPRPSAL